MEKGKLRMGRRSERRRRARYTESGQRKALLSPPHLKSIAEDILVVKSNVGSVRIER
jgi:hypothetical protein